MEERYNIFLVLSQTKGLFTKLSHLTMSIHYFQTSLSILPKFIKTLIPVHIRGTLGESLSPKNFNIYVCPFLIAEFQLLLLGNI